MQNVVEFMKLGQSRVFSIFRARFKEQENDL